MSDGKNKKAAAAAEDKKTIGLTVKKSEDFSEWYTQVIAKAELADYTKVSGCLVLRPYAYAIWEKIVKEVDARLKKMRVQNCYFPLLIPESLLKKEEQHIQGFAPEVAWVTHASDTKLDERLAVRPTSETIMYDSVSKWVRSWRDLPLKLNQWNNVVRWEFKHPTPFIRTREFLWNEGHTAFATKEEAEAEIGEILSLWKDITENFLAVAGITGQKSQSEKFAGAVASYSIEFFLPNGRAAQGPDAHFDGQNFAKAFDITFLNEKGEKDYVWQNTWAITTRMIGILAMVHGDDKGLVIPPNIAPVQIVIVPILFEDSKKEVLAAANKIRKELEKESIAAEVDGRETYTAGWKFNEWELKGVPVRIEIGPRDMQQKQAIIVRRDTSAKETVKLEAVAAAARKTLAEIQESLYQKSKQQLENSIVAAKNIGEIATAVKSKKLAKADFCGSAKCEAEVKEKADGATSRCMTLLEPKSTEADWAQSSQRLGKGSIQKREQMGKCVVCGKEGVASWFGKAY
ncbi:proline--tRNA ligase [Candidatus Woesearchaeota archaeon]|nr:proline--tRNA ligase [Candidatus Woesearchaeota archaeon]